MMHPNSSNALRWMAAVFQIWTPALFSKSQHRDARTPPLASAIPGTGSDCIALANRPPPQPDNASRKAPAFQRSTGDGQMRRPTRSSNDGAGIYTQRMRR